MTQPPASCWGRQPGHPSAAGKIGGSADAPLPTPGLQGAHRSPGAGALALGTHTPNCKLKSVLCCLAARLATTKKAEPPGSES